MADNQVTISNNLARKIIPKTRKCLPQQQEAARQKDYIGSQILQECRARIQDPQGSHRI